MNVELLAAFLNDNNGFDGGVYELWTALKNRNEFRLLPDLPSCGEDFLIDLRKQVPALKTRGVEIVLLPHGGVRIKTALEAREELMSENLLRAQYNESAQLRREFSSYESYAAYQKAYANGRAKSVTHSRSKDSQQSNAAQSDVDPRLPLEERCRQRWAIEPGTRAEFHDNYGAFLAFEKANARGQARVFRAG